MELQVIATGSSGNSYFIEHHGRLLLLDAGVTFKRIKSGIGFRVINVDGALITHMHQDHSKAIDDLVLAGIPVWQPYLCDNKIQSKQFGDFRVRSFDLPHEDVSNTGFLIDVGGVRILYATDFEYIKYKFKNVNYFIVEANYSPDIIDEEGGGFSHSILGHASIETTLDFLKANQSEALRGVILCHLSGRYADPDGFQTLISNSLDCEVYIAEPGLVVKLNEETDES